MIFKIDVDGVMRDMLAVMVRLYNERFGTNLTKEDVFSYNIAKSFPLYAENGIDPYQFLFADHKDEVIGDAPIFPGAKETIDLIKSEGHKIVIVTHQPTLDAKILTLKWLDKHGIKYDDICFTNQSDKRNIKCHVIIDDCMDHLDAETSAIKVCIDYAYNRKKDYDFRLKSLSELWDIWQNTKYK